MKRDMRRDSATIEREGREGEERDGDAEGESVSEGWRARERRREAERKGRMGEKSERVSALQSGDLNIWRAVPVTNGGAIGVETRRPI